MDYDKAVTSYQDDAQHNFAVYREYDGASHYNETNLPREYDNAGAGTRPGGVGPMGAPVGAGHGKAEDSEHQRKVLIEADAEDTFGSAVLTAPQGIGDDEYEDR